MVYSHEIPPFDRDIHRGISPRARFRLSPAKLWIDPALKFTARMVINKVSRTEIYIHLDKFVHLAMISI